jgi:hypothetical protein
LFAVWLGVGGEVKNPKKNQMHLAGFEKATGRAVGSCGCQGFLTPPTDQFHRSSIEILLRKALSHCFNLTFQSVLPLDTDLPVLPAAIPKKQMATFFPGGVFSVSSLTSPSMVLRDRKNEPSILVVLFISFI